MTVSRNVLSALAAAAAIGKANAAFGSAFSTGATSTGIYIIESWATLNLPDVPTDNEGDLSLWVGMGTSNGDLIQSIAENYNTDDWSIYAYTLQETSADTQYANQAVGSTAEAGTAVTFHYYYVSSTGNYTQDVIVDGTIVSTLSTSDGEAEGWGSAVECAAENCGTVPAHTWTNVTITLSGADAAYIDTLVLGEGVTATMSTSDDGITWDVGTIDIPGYDFTTSSVTDDTVSTTTTSATTATSSDAATSSNDSSTSTSTTNSGSSSSGASGAVPSGTATTGSQSSAVPNSGSSSTGPSGAQPSGSFGFGGFGGFGGHHKGSSPMASAAASTNSFAGWARSRISRHIGGQN